MLDSNLPSVPRRDPWNKGRLIGQKRPLKPKDVWSIRVRLQVERRARNLALFNLAIDSKLRGCDLVRLQVEDVSVGGRVRDRATIVQKKTGRPVQFEITEQTRAAIQAWLADIRSRSARCLFPSRVRMQPHLSTRQYARIVHSWVASAGLDSVAAGVKEHVGSFQFPCVAGDLKHLERRVPAKVRVPGFRAAVAGILVPASGATSARHLKVGDSNFVSRMILPHREFRPAINASSEVHQPCAVGLSNADRLEFSLFPYQRRHLREQMIIRPVHHGGGVPA